MRTWLLRPFSRIAGTTALMAGLGGIVATAILGWFWQGVFTDGVIDLHIGPAAPIHVFFVQATIAWLGLSLGLLIAGHMLTTTRYRLIDLLGTQALARWPMLPATLVIGLPGYRRALEGPTTALLNGSGSPADMLIVLVLSLVPIAAVVWMVWLMYHSYSIVFNLKGMRGALSFTVVLIGAEIIAKVLILAFRTA